MATLRGDIKQRELEAFEVDYNPRIRNDKGEIELNGQQRFYGASVRAAVAAGWFSDLTTQEQVDALTGKEIRALHAQVHALYGELTELDPN
jgi:hypothetical protein